MKIFGDWGGWVGGLQSERATVFHLDALLGSGVPRNLVRVGGFQQIQLRTEDRGKGGLGALDP